MGEHQVQVSLCKVRQRVTVRNNVPDEIVIVLDMRFLSALHWVAVEDVEPDFACA